MKPVIVETKKFKGEIYFNKEKKEYEISEN